MKQLLNRFLLLQPAWLPTVLFIPLLYALGWIAAVPLTLIGLPADQVSLTGTVLSFVLFLLVMPTWAQVRWNKRMAFKFLGLNKQRLQKQPSLIILLKGFILSLLLLSLIVIPLVTRGWATWHNTSSLPTFTNAMALGLGVGLAEELIFRGWLQTELHIFWGTKRAAVGQAMIFSLVHTRFNLGVRGMLSLILGLFALGLLLWLLRQSENGSLWAPVGLHGGLVAGWFVLQSDLLTIQDVAPTWLVGPGAPHTNPLGSGIAIVAITGLNLLLLKRMSQDPLHGQPNQRAQ